jgi:hypothetical protein
MFLSYETFTLSQQQSEKRSAPYFESNATNLATTATGFDGEAADALLCAAALADMPPAEVITCSLFGAPHLHCPNAAAVMSIL